MNKKMSKRQRDIKTKLMAAICMLLVSSIMMVSTTYAWFTLSTAPEVTGIQTAVGANGNLEMALLPSNGITQGQGADYGITSNVNDSMYIEGKDVKIANVTWGNLVSLKDGYGLDKITLYPSQLNLVDGTTNMIDQSVAILETPEYGADGRITSLRANTQTGIYGDGSFMPTEEAWGVRAIGTASGLSEREQSYRTARGTMVSIAGAVRTAATTSLTTNGKALANIVVKYADDGANATFTNADLSSISVMISDLNAMMAQIDTAYKNAVMAIIASGHNTQDDAAVKASQILFDNTTSLDAFLTALYGTDNANKDTVDAMLTNVGLITADSKGPIDQYRATVQSIATAKEELDKLTDDNHTWNEVKNVLTYIANPDNMEVNGYKTNDVDKQTLIDSILGGSGINITILPGGGAFADIADHCDNYKAKVPMGGITAAGYTMPDTMTANMETKTTNFYLNTYYEAIGTNPPPAAATGSTPITDYYGYIIDLAFRTNAAESKLLLQVDPADRIYDDNSNEDTRGHGSNMTFSAASPDFSNDDIKNLMKSIKIVFFKTQTGEIVANAYLDADHAAITADGVTADIHLLDSDVVPTFSVTSDAGKTSTYYGTRTADANGVVTTIYTNASGVNQYKTVYTPAAADNSTTEKTEYFAWIAESTDESTGTTTPAAWATTATTEAADIAALEALKVEYTTVSSGEVIMDLTQNTATPLSVLVYLDGTSVKNADVAYSSATSMTGTMNLQFASSANLTAMEYSALHTTGDGSYEVTVATGSALQIDGNAKAYKGSAYEFTLKDAADGTTYSVTYTIGETTTTLTANDDGSYTIPAESVTGAITINVTANS